MRTVTAHHRHDVVVVEIDGTLDVVAGHDLRQTVGEVLRTSTGIVVSLDLSRVTSADDHGVAALAWCSDHAILTGRVLTWSTCSQPLVRDLRARARVPRRRT